MAVVIAAAAAAMANHIGAFEMLQKAEWAEVEGLVNLKAMVTAGKV